MAQLQAGDCQPDSSDDEGERAPPPPTKDYHKRQLWAGRFSSGQNVVYSDEPACCDPLNDTQPLLGSAADVGRFVLIRVDAYPNLKQSTRNGAEHLGWSMKIVKFDKKRL